MATRKNKQNTKSQFTGEIHNEKNNKLYNYNQFTTNEIEHDCLYLRLID